jgi:hypothetical protein
MKYDLILARMDMVKRPKITNAGEDVEKGRPSHAVNESANYASHQEK